MKRIKFLIWAICLVTQAFDVVAMSSRPSVQAPSPKGCADLCSDSLTGCVIALQDGTGCGKDFQQCTEACLERGRTQEE